MRTASDNATTGWRVAADIGGTFTDVLLWGPGGQVAPMKVLSTPPEFGAGVLAGIRGLLQSLELPPGDVTTVLHATTVATNAILEGRGAVTALVTTRGFRDVLEIGRLRRPTLYDLSWEKPVPLARRRHRHEIDQRIDSRGELAPAANLDEVDAIAAQMLADGVEAVAVCLINSYLRPDEERRVAAALAAAMPDCYVTASVDISPEVREFERTSTAVVNSYVGPTVARYLQELGRQLVVDGLDCPFLIMQSSGGLLEAGPAVARPAQIIESGPAAGVIACQKLSQTMALPSAVAFDMGGTTAKASLIEGGKPFLASNYEVGGGMNVQRGLGQGAGYTVRIPSLDIAEVGAGGGSVVWADEVGILHVGPHSAGASPGPACYGAGGDQPTLTDANVVLGYINPHALAGGRVPVEPALATDVIGKLAGDMGLDAMALARGAFDIAVSNMTKAVKAVTSERGRDPRGSSMIAFGGAGPLYAADMAHELGIDTVIVPRHPGLFSSLGLLVADVERESVTPCQFDQADTDAVERAFRTLETEVNAELVQTGHRADALETRRLLDLRYRQQRFEIRIPITSAPFDTSVLQQARADFHAEHHRTYGRAGTDDLVEIVNLRVTCAAPNALAIADVLGSGTAGRVGQERACFFGSWIETPVLGRDELDGTPRPGPLVIEDMDATTLVPPGATCHVDPLLNIVITWQTQAED